LYFLRTVLMNSSASEALDMLTRFPMNLDLVTTISLLPFSFITLYESFNAKFIPFQKPEQML